MPEQPPFLRLADLLRQRLNAGEWSPGDRFPSRSELRKEYEEGDGTVKRALQLLIAQGLLEGRSGSGTYVAEPRERVRVVRSRSREQRDGAPWSHDMADLGRHASWEYRTEAKVPAPPGIAARLGLAEGDLCVRTRYEFLADGQPAQLSTSWEPYDLTAGTLVVLPEGGPYAGRGVIERMAAIGITVSHAVEQPEPRKITVEEATLLGVQRGSLVTEIRRTFYADDGQAVETADIIVPATRCEIVYEVPVNPG